MTDKAENPVYAVIGATGGIGSVLCRILAAGGARLVVGARREEPLEKLAADLDAKAMPVDARDFGQVDEFLKLAASFDEPLRGVVNCAGSLILKAAHLTTRDEFDEAIALNVSTAFATVRSAARVLRERGGSIVLASSAAALAGIPHHEAIAAAKGAVAGLTLSAAATYASWGVRVNAVAPGLVRTPLTRSIVENASSLEASLGLHPLGRVGEPEDIASLMAWLLGPESTWVTGQVWSVDGGLASLKSRKR